MHVTLRQLTVFAAVARHLSYTRAAEELHLSQPAVSIQVKQLEESVGTPLFEKLGKRIFLTDAGRIVHRASQTIADELRSTEEALAALKGLQRGHLRLTVATTANHFATRVLAAFSQQFEGVTFSLNVTNRKRLLAELAANETDMVIMGKPPAELDLESTLFMENPLVVIGAADHPLAKQKKSIPLARIADETFVVREADSGTRIAMKRFFDDRNIVFKAGMEMTSNEAIKHAVEAGLGLGIVSVHTLELELEAKRLAVLNVEDFPIMRHWYMVQLAGKQLSPVAQAFKDFVLDPAHAPLMASPVAHPVARAAARSSPVDQ